MNIENIISLDFIIKIAVLLFAVSVHESAHAWMANKFGDPTAKNQGRITLNPIPHIDLVGSIIFPFILAITPGAPVFGWAKPVMVNPYNLRDPRRANMFISAAGPGSNIITAIVGIVVFLILKHLGLVDPIPLFYLTGTNPGPLTLILFYLIIINIFLAIFNLIPIPPLDGSHILEGVLKGEALYKYQKIKPYGFIILIVIIFTGVLSVIANPFYVIIRSILLRG
jgi:Zn-dependent protease